MNHLYRHQSEGGNIKGIGVNMACLFWPGIYQYNNLIANPDGLSDN